jgi:hypothetical protein
MPAVSQISALSQTEGNLCLLSLEPNKTYKLKYRIVTYDGEMTPEKAERMYDDFVNTPTLKIN